MHGLNELASCMAPARRAACSPSAHPTYTRQSISCMAGQPKRRVLSCSRALLPFISCMPSSRTSACMHGTILKSKTRRGCHRKALDPPAYYLAGCMHVYTQLATLYFPLFFPFFMLVWKCLVFSGTRQSCSHRGTSRIGPVSQLHTPASRESSQATFFFLRSYHYT